MYPTCTCRTCGRAASGCGLVHAADQRSTPARAHAVVLLATDRRRTTDDRQPAVLYRYVPAHLATRPVCRRARWQMGRPICQHFVPSADGTVGRRDGPSANILSRLQTSATRRPIWRLFVHPRRCAATLGVLPIL